MQIITIGTGQKGGIDSVIQGYVDDGLFDEVKHKRIVSHLGEGKLKDGFLFISSSLTLIVQLLLNRKSLLHLHMSYKGSFWRKLLFFLIARSFRCPVVVHLHGSEFKSFFSQASNCTKSMIVHLIKNCDRFVVLSESWADYIKQISGIRPEVINNYVDVRINSSIRNKKDLLFLAAFIERKGIYDLLKACANLKSDYHLHLCGGGEDKEVNAMIKKLGLESRVTNHGWVDKEKKYQLLNSCGVMVLPSYNEGLPMTLVEAMGCELPTVVTPVGAIGEVIENNMSGFLVKPGDVNGLQTTLDSILGGHHDLMEITKNAKKIYKEKFTGEIVLPKWKKLYKDLLS